MIIVIYWQFIDQGQVGLNSSHSLDASKYDQKVSRQSRKIVIAKKNLQETNKVLRLLIRIRSENCSNGVKLRFEYDHIAPSGFGVADQEGIDSYVLFGLNTTYV